MYKTSHSISSESCFQTLISLIVFFLCTSGEFSRKCIMVMECVVVWLSIIMVLRLRNGCCRLSPTHMHVKSNITKLLSILHIFNSSQVCVQKKIFPESSAVKKTKNGWIKNELKMYKGKSREDRQDRLL